MSARIRPLPLDVWKMQNAAIYQHILCASVRQDMKVMLKHCAQVSFPINEPKYT